MHSNYDITSLYAGRNEKVIKKMGNGPIYLIRNGEVCGIVHGWGSAQPLVKGFPNASYQGCKADIERAWELFIESARLHPERLMWKKKMMIME